MNKLSKKPLRTDKASLTATLMLKKRNMMRREKSCRAFVILSLSPEWIRRVRMLKRKMSSAMRVFDFVYQYSHNPMSIKLFFNLKLSAKAIIIEVLTLKI